MKVALTIAGAEPSGGAGVAADLRAFAALGVHGAAVLTAVTAQSIGDRSTVGEMSAESVRHQLASVEATSTPDAIKIGLLPTVALVEEVCTYLSGHPDRPAVLDPVLGSSGGMQLAEEGVPQAILELLLPRVELLTPNHPELEALLRRPVGSSQEELVRAARELISGGGHAVLLKGGHRVGETVDDVFVDAHSVSVYSVARIGGVPARGTGCLLASAIAALRARGHDLPTAVGKAKEFLTPALEASFFAGTSRMPVPHAFWEYYGSEGLP